ncbi:MAG TPA: hypothetical protein DHV08_01605 [Rhodocyclaceae bacterium]|nr:MAG: hypothetical protein AUK49_13085 [Betaproteobacteria bacterium CG2_30_68_42]PIX76064.1 MAG: hypothetical protein COZ38_02320 [Rhodocyclales bacterium CG_4_10_14_3_um_filter_68_10]PJA58580.1 MAG: hypothetical protein CO164_01660 [Rhodocyclales bacterium CG_4_9_14_3_um_filter_68_10]HCX32356.1 hypothetical protein [Rhodocyclaceae bacterium]
MQRTALRVAADAGRSTARISLPSTIPIDDARVQSELTRYLSDNWVPILEKDVDGPRSLPLKIDGDQADTFAHAESHDETAGRYRGLRAGQMVSVSPESTALLVKPDVALRQMDAEAPAAAAANTAGSVISAAAGAAGPTGTTPGATGPSGRATPPPPRRFHGTVRLDPARVGRDASRIAEEVIAHLVGQVGAEVTVTLEVEATLPHGASDQIVRTVTENCRTLKFSNHGFERE